MPVACLGPAHSWGHHAPVEWGTWLMGSRVQSYRLRIRTLLNIHGSLCHNIWRSRMFKNGLFSRSPSRERERRTGASEGEDRKHVARGPRHIPALRSQSALLRPGYLQSGACGEIAFRIAVFCRCRGHRWAARTNRRMSRAIYSHNEPHEQMTHTTMSLHRREQQHVHENGAQPTSVQDEVEDIRPPAWNARPPLSWVRQRLVCARDRCRVSRFCRAAS